jgi:hypothetical protein
MDPLASGLQQGGDIGFGCRIDEIEVEKFGSAKGGKHEKSLLPGVTGGKRSNGLLFYFVGQAS